MVAKAHLTEHEPPVAVLLFDDEQNDLKGLQRLMLEERCEVLSANSGREGLDILKRNQNVGVIVSDQRMAEMTGAEFLAQVRRVAPYAMKIVLTGYADIHAVRDAINKGGAHCYMRKPWNDVELLEVIRSGLATYRLVLDSRRQEEDAKAERRNLWALNEKLQRVVSRQAEELKEREDEVDLCLYKERK